jgi:hypothetical protein
MAGDYENMRDLENLSSEELRGTIREQLRAHNMLDVDDITVRLERDEVVLEGRVGTDSERRVAEHVLTDVLGIVNVRNDLIVDAIRRAESPEAVDDHLVSEERSEGLLLGDRPSQHNDEAVMLDHEDFLDERLSGTTDVGDAIAGANPWVPPESPTPEGLDREVRGREELS